MKLTPTRATLLRLIGYSDVQCTRDGALHPRYVGVNGEFRGAELPALRWLFDAEMVRCLDQEPLYRLGVGRVVPTSKGRKWLDNNKLEG